MNNLLSVYVMDNVDIRIIIYISQSLYKMTPIFGQFENYSRIFCCPSIIQNGQFIKGNMNLKKYCRILCLIKHNITKIFHKLFFIYFIIFIFVHFCFYKYFFILGVKIF
jgi:hypothetical protein